jgi:hypothetical protein
MAPRIDGALSAKDLDLLFEVYEERERVAIARALNGISLASASRTASAPLPAAAARPCPRHRDGDQSPA